METFSVAINVVFLKSIDILNEWGANPGLDKVKRSFKKILKMKFL